MILKLKFKKQVPSVLFVSKEDDGITIEEYEESPSKCVYARWLSAAQARELKKFLEAKGF